MDRGAVNAFAFRVWSQRQGAVVSQMIHLGVRLGLYRAMARQGAMTASELASRAEVDSRYAEEWLRGQAAAGLLEYENGAFELTDEGAAVLADDDTSPFFSGHAFAPIDAKAQAERLARVFESGGGHGYDDGGDDLLAQLDGMNRPWARLLLPTIVVDGVRGLRQTLEAGASVVDVGCGSGQAIAALAEAFPASTFHGIDVSTRAIELATDRLASLGNATAVVGDVDSLAGRPVDIFLAFDVLHDMARPDAALSAMREVIADDGLLVVKDIKTTPTFEGQQKNPMLAMMYGLSVMSCLPSGLSAEGGLGLGNQGLHPDLLERMSVAAGFRSFQIHDLGDPVNLYYEIRP